MNGLFLSVAIVVLVRYITRIFQPLNSILVEDIMGRIISVGFILNVLGNAARQSLQCKRSWNRVHTFLLAIIRGLISISFTYIMAIGVSTMMLKSYSAWKFTFGVFVINTACAFPVFFGLEILMDSFHIPSQKIYQQFTIVLCLILCLTYLILFSSPFPLIILQSKISEIPITL